MQPTYKYISQGIGAKQKHNIDIASWRREARGTSGTVGKLQARLQKGNWWDHVPASVHLVVQIFGYILLGETRCLPQCTLYLGIMVNLEKSALVQVQVHESHMKSYVNGTLSQVLR